MQRERTGRRREAKTNPRGLNDIQPKERIRVVNLSPLRQPMRQQPRIRLLQPGGSANLYARIGQVNTEHHIGLSAQGHSRLTRPQGG